MIFAFSDVPAPGSAASRKRRRRAGPLRWLLRGVIVLLLLVIVGVGAGPWALSQPAIRDAMFRAASRGLQGELRLADLSLAWFSPSRLGGLVILDEDQREVLHVKEIHSSRGLWQLLRGLPDIGEIEIDGAVVRLIPDAAGQYSLQAALRPPGSAAPPAPPGAPQPPPHEDEGPPPALRGKLVLSNSEISIQQPDGATLAARELNATLQLDTLNDIQGTFAMLLQDSGRIEAAVQVRQLAAGGRLDPQQAVGNAELKTSGLALRPLAAFAGQDVTGEAQFALTASFDGQSVTARLSAELRRVVAAQAAAAGVQPLDAALNAELGLSDRVLTLESRLQSDAGSAAAELKHRLGEARFDAGKLLAAALTGESVNLPDLTLTARADLDLAQVDRAVPGLLKVRGDRRIAGGRLQVQDVSVRLGAEAEAQGWLEVRELTVADPGGGRTVAAPIRVAFDTKLQPGQGLLIQQLELQSAAAEVSARGLLKNVTAGFRADLAKLETELGGLLDLGFSGLSGALSGTLTAAQPADERIDISLQAAGEQVRFASGEQAFSVPRAALQQRGHLALSGHNLARLVIEEAAIDLNNEVLASSRGSFDFAGGGFEADIDARQINLTFLAQQAAALGLNELARYNGRLAGTLRLAQAGRDQPIRSSGALRGEGLLVDGQPLVEQAVTLNWTDAELAPGTGALRVAAARLDSAIAKLSASEVGIGTTPALTLKGRIEGEAELAPLFAAVGRVARMEQPPNVAGRLTLKTQGTAADQRISVSGEASIDQLAIGAARSSGGQVNLTYEARIDPDREELRLEKFTLASTPLSAELSGAVQRYRSPTDLAMTGKYEASWPELTRLLHELAPATRGLVEVAGRSSSTFDVRGAAQQPGAQPPFRGVASGLGLTWESARLYGIRLGAARFEPTLRDGRVTLPTTAIASAGGQVRLGGVLDFQPADPTLRVDGSLKVLENIELSTVLAEALLSYFNPLFASVVSVEGRVNLDVQDVSLPLGESLQTASQGAGRLDLQTVRMQTGGPLLELLALGGLVGTEPYAVQFSAVDFRVRDGRIMYDDFRMVFPPDYDLVFRGSVGFDSTLDLVVSIPVRAELLQRLGLKGASAQMAERLAGSRIDVPLVGTRAQPRLDFSKVDTTKLMQGLLPPPQQAVGDLLKGLSGGAKPDEPADKKPERGIGDLLRKLPGGKPE